MRGKAAHQRAVLAFGPKPAVDLPERGHADARDDRLAHTLQRGGDSSADSGQLAGVSVLVGRLHDIDQIHVRNVVQLACAELAHADDCEPAAFAPLDFMAGDG